MSPTAWTADELRIPEAAQARFAHTQPVETRAKRRCEARPNLNQHAHPPTQDQPAIWRVVAVAEDALAPHSNRDRMSHFRMTKVAQPVLRTPSWA